MLKNWQISLKHLIQFLGESITIIIEGFQYLDEIAVKELQQRFQNVGTSLEYPVMYVSISPHCLTKLSGIIYDY